MSNLPEKYENLLGSIREVFGEGFIPLHAPVFNGNEKQYLAECIDTTFVSSVGAFVDRFEQMMAEIAGTKYAIATMNGTAALHLALILADVGENDEVITQPLTFVATCNAISYQKAHSVFVDVDKETLGLSPKALKDFLEKNAFIKDNQCINKSTGRIIKAVVPMHTFGISAAIDEIKAICTDWNLVLIEDAAEALGSRYKEKALGSYGDLAAFSFNGNKIVTSGGGGCVVTNDEKIAKRAKHLSTTAKLPHAWQFFHDEVGYNYRLPNVNAALACAQLEQLPIFLEKKKQLASFYADICEKNDIPFISNTEGGESNFWLNAILVEDFSVRETLLAEANKRGIMMRPVWELMSDLPAFSECQNDGCETAKWLQERLVNIPSSVISL
ncbi:LegC family aminotransferase [Acinetobacter sp. NIPH1876]|uniref:LegC family aminotransferase n=1 Tax=Acinetobacter sp. NIPH1876 TaxID=2924041 RepID=UPI001FAB7186|nr:LegC family aminotransferase [Acinetobacter sp. NIPH1876]MCJ0829595.1 LegC family aminotransferase [Acinetobacter sp. NIPH1876]